MDSKCQATVSENSIIKPSKELAMRSDRTSLWKQKWRQRVSVIKPRFPDINQRNQNRWTAQDNSAALFIHFVSANGSRLHGSIPAGSRGSPKRHAANCERKLRRAPDTALHAQRSILSKVASFRSVATFPIDSLTNSGVAAAAFQIKIQGELKRKRNEEFRNLPEILGRSDALVRIMGATETLATLSRYNTRGKRKEYVSFTSWNSTS